MAEKVSKLIGWRRLILQIGLPLLLVLILTASWGLLGENGNLPVENEEEEEGKGRRHSGQVLTEVIQAPIGEPITTPVLPATGFIPQTRLGYTIGDQWEPSIAADRFGHVYIFYPQYLGVPGCPECPSPTIVLQVSNDWGATWSAPRIIASPGSGQWDPQIVVDPEDGRTVYAAWLQNSKSDTMVAKSTDFGATWSAVIANRTKVGTDKPILAVRGPHVYVAYNHSQKIWVSASHDGGATFTSVQANRTVRLGWSLSGGGTVAPNGEIYFAWAGYTKHGNASGDVNLYFTRSANRGRTWKDYTIDVSAAPPTCEEYECGWAFLGAQLTVASDEGGTLYALWNAGAVPKGPERIYFARSTDSGASWSPRTEVSTAPEGTAHAFPALVAGAAGDVRIAWMDNRGGSWNVYYRVSSDRGETWSAETDLSTYVDGFEYIVPEGFRFPFGDYFELAIDDRGLTHAVWGEGWNYDSPGSIWYTRGQ